MGAVTPFGFGVAHLMEALWAGRSAVRDMRPEWQDRLADLNCWVAAPIIQPLGEKSIPRHARRGMGRTTILAHSAAAEALNDAGIPPEMHGSGRMGIAFGSTTGSVAAVERLIHDCIETKSVRNLSSGAFFQIMNHTAAGNLAYAFGITGETVGPASACATASQAIGLGWDAIAEGRQDAMLCGGCDELHPIVVGTLDQLQAASWHYNDAPRTTPRPFDARRDGTVCGEGAGAVVLEAEATARARGAKFQYEILGHAHNTDGANLSESSAKSISECLGLALERSGVYPGDIDFINAHATGTPAGDLAEAQAIERRFKPKALPVCGFKGALSHTLAASCAIELIASIEMALAGRLIPTHNLEQPGEGCDGLDHVLAPRESPTRTFIKDSFGFGGINSILVLRRCGNGAC